MTNKRDVWVLRHLNEASRLTRKAREEMYIYYELSIGLLGGALSEEEREKRKRRAYLNVLNALEDILIELDMAKETLAYYDEP